jgi:hypothetical protein
VDGVAGAGAAQRRRRLSVNADAAESTRRAALRWLPALAVAVVFLGHDARRLVAPFGPSHDGFNAALFMTGGRAIVEEGPIASRLGAVSHTRFGDPAVYAHHPPLIYIASAAAYLVPVPVELRARLPALVAALGALICSVLLLSQCGIEPGPAAVGLLVAFATPMFFVSGAVTQPDGLGLLPMTGLVLLSRRSPGEAGPFPRALGAVAAAATLTSWEAALLAGLVATGLLIDRRRGAAAAVLLGAAAGLALTGLWMLWAYQGDLSGFVQRALLRVGVGEEDRVGVFQMAGKQLRYLHDLFPVGRGLVLALAGLGLFDRRTRAPAAVALSTVLGYAVAFKNGAYDHSYWLYPLLLPLALGAAVAADAVSRRLAGGALSRLATVALGVALIVALAVLAIARVSDEQIQDAIGARVGAQARALAWPDGQRYAYHTLGGRGASDLLPWLAFYSRREPFGVDGPSSVPRGEVLVSLIDGRLRSIPGERP